MSQFEDHDSPPSEWTRQKTEGERFGSHTGSSNSLENSANITDHNTPDIDDYEEKSADKILELEKDIDSTVVPYQKHEGILNYTAETTVSHIDGVNQLSNSRKDSNLDWFSGNVLSSQGIGVALHGSGGRFNTMLFEESMGRSNTHMSCLTRDQESMLIEALLSSMAKYEKRQTVGSNSFNVEYIPSEHRSNKDETLPSHVSPNDNGNENDLFVAQKSSSSATSILANYGNSNRELILSNDAINTVNISNDIKISHGGMMSEYSEPVQSQYDIVDSSGNEEQDEIAEALCSEDDRHDSLHNNDNYIPIIMDRKYANDKEQVEGNNRACDLEQHISYHDEIKTGQTRVKTENLCQMKKYHLNNNNSIRPEFSEHVVLSQALEMMFDGNHDWESHVEAAVTIRTTPRVIKKEICVNEKNIIKQRDCEYYKIDSLKENKSINTDNSRGSSSVLQAERTMTSHSSKTFSRENYKSHKTCDYMNDHSCSISCNSSPFVSDYISGTRNSTLSATIPIGEPSPKRELTIYAPNKSVETYISSNPNEVHEQADDIQMDEEFDSKSDREETHTYPSSAETKCPIHVPEYGRTLFYGYYEPFIPCIYTPHGPVYQRYQMNSSCQVTPLELGFDSMEAINNSLNAKSEIIIKPPQCFGASVKFKDNVAKSVLAQQQWIANTVFQINWNAFRRRKRRWGIDCC